MTWKCAFKKLWTSAYNLGSLIQCPPKTFHGFWCLVDEISTLASGVTVTLSSEEDDLVIGPFEEDRLFMFRADPDNSAAIEIQEEGSVSVSLLAGAVTSIFVDAGNTMTILAPGSGTRSGRYYVLAV